METAPVKFARLLSGKAPLNRMNDPQITKKRPRRLSLAAGRQHRLPGIAYWNIGY
ncbi:hypothetical protein SAMN04488557_0735 [Hyphomicrobium facile]|uniref:Uncharacterized protein n=1 Tax=Hyphomicrobium facile TaxID=51670 RepID=A0A1I7MY43_9HYPH|nr:hypothetical protein SAMN04488557_0735 [Hyphomicrobium facile]